MSDLCPECRTKSLAQYVDKYGLIEGEWTQDQIISTMQAILYARMDWERKAKEGERRGFEKAKEMAAKIIDPACTIHLPKEFLEPPYSMDGYKFLDMLASNIRALQFDEEKKDD